MVHFDQKKTIIIRPSREGFYLNPTLLIPGSQTNLPWKYMTFRDGQHLFWKVTMDQYHEAEKSLVVEVVDYDPEDVTAFVSQSPKKDILFLHFGKLDWTQLQLQLSSFQKSKLRDILTEEGKSQSFDSNFAKVLPEEINFSASTLKETDSFTIPEDEKYEWKESFWITFNDSNIGLGYITFPQYISRVDRLVHFKIYNDHLLPEFNVIRYWFAKKLGTKRFYVHATIMTEGREVVDTHATSTQIDQIGPGMIDSIRYQRVYSLKKEPKIIPPDKNLFTADEIFGLWDAEDEQGNVFRQSEEEILAMLLEKSGIRNKKQLAYLAGSKQSGSVKLRFTLYPHFGFVFFIEGEECNHFVWELLNTHATYVWSFDKKEKSREQCYQHLERTINLIRSGGRDTYKQAYHDRTVDQDIVFHFIPHEDIDSKLVDGFPRWKMRLNEQLI